MNTETAQITAAKRDKLQKTGEEFLNVEVTFKLGKTTEVRSYAYPVDTPQKEILQDIKQKLKTRKLDREHAEKLAAEAEANAEAEATVAALEGKQVK